MKFYGPRTKDLLRETTGDKALKFCLVVAGV